MLPHCCRGPGPVTVTVTASVDRAAEGPQAGAGLRLASRHPAPPRLAQSATGATPQRDCTLREPSPLDHTPRRFLQRTYRACPSLAWVHTIVSLARPTSSGEIVVGIFGSPWSLRNRSERAAPRRREGRCTASSFLRS